MLKGFINLFAPHCKAFGMSALLIPVGMGIDDMH